MLIGGTNVDIKLMLGFLTKNFLFNFSLILVSIILNWILYSYLILKKTKLKYSLFEKDSFAAWIEFIGAFILPTLSLSAYASKSPASNNVFIDFLICCAYSIIYIVLFNILKFTGNKIISFSHIYGNDKRIDINKEIFEENNTALAIYSTSLSIIFINIVKLFDIDTDYFMLSLLKISNVLIFTLISYIIYILILNNKTTLFKEVFINNNAASVTSFLGFTFAVQYILDNTISLQTDFIFIELLAISMVSLLVFGILSVLIKYIFTFIAKVDFWKEIYLQSNIGAAIGQSALYIGIACVIIGFIR